MWHGVVCSGNYQWFSFAQEENVRWTWKDGGVKEAQRKRVLQSTERSLDWGEPWKNIHEEWQTTRACGRHPCSHVDFANSLAEEEGLRQGDLKAKLDFVKEATGITCYLQPESRSNTKACFYRKREGKGLGWPPPKKKLGSKTEGSTRWNRQSDPVTPLVTALQRLPREADKDLWGI